MANLRLNRKQRAIFDDLRSRLDGFDLSDGEMRLLASLAQLALKFRRAQVVVFSRHFVRKEKPC